MKKVLLFLFLIPSVAYAGDEEFDCHKNKEFAVECKAKKDNVAISRAEINGGNCESSAQKLSHKILKNGEKVIIPGSKECGYVATVTVHTNSGKTQHFYAM
jgi:hypothetical protein